MLATVRVSALRMRSNVASTASWVITVTSRSPSWRRRMISSMSALASAICSRLFASTRIRNSASVLNKAWAAASGTMTISSVLDPSDSPCFDMMPITRKRRSPMRTHSPSAGRVPNSSLATLEPMTQTGWLWRGSPSGRNRPCAVSMWRMSNSSAVDPSTGVSRLRAPARTLPAPMISGAKRRTAWLRLSASASSMVRSRGVLPISTPGMAPAVSLRPGRTMIRLLPSEPN